MRSVLARLLLAVLLVAAALTMTLIPSGATSALKGQQPPQHGYHLQGATPTAEAEDGSRPGSTTGIEWMGIAIAAIILLPIFLRRATWKKT